MKKRIAIMMALIICAGSALLTSCTENTKPVSIEQPTLTTESVTDATEEKIKDLKYAPYQTYQLDTSAPIKNIIILIGDGMGFNHIRAAELQKGDQLNMRGMKHKGEVTTSSLDGVTDSAASATAISCGVKTRNGYIAVDEEGNDVENLFEFAKKNNMKTGFTMTEYLPHATPAAFSSHALSRNEYMNILKQQINNQVNVMLGAGQRFYNTNFDTILKKNNYHYMTKANELISYQENKNLMGMFKYEIILAGYQPSLADMTSKALELLENDNGFCLLVEGSDIDTRASIKNMDTMLREMTIFDNAVDVVLQYAEKNPGTLVIVTADHETGGLEFAENTTASELTNDMFTSDGEHTDANVPIFVDGAQADKFITGEVMDNTDIARQIRYLYNGTEVKHPANNDFLLAS